jgi:eukaryotic-like serine/threonine-protein kinase
MSLKEFLISRVFFKNLSIAVAFLVGTVLILLIWLNIYTRHGQARPVPDFYGLTLDETAKLARKNKLIYEIVDSVYTKAVPAGCIAEQNPTAGFKVKKRRRIMLTINAFRPEMVRVPNLVGLPYRQAIKTIQSAGLDIGERKYIPDLSVDFVIKQLYRGKEITDADSVQKGSGIDLVLGKGLSNQRTPVPNLVGLKLEAARNTILYSSLNLGAFMYDNSIQTAGDTVNAFVFSQRPEYKDNATLQLGSSDIYLWLTVDSLKLPVDSTRVILPDTLKIEDKKKELPNQNR